MLVVLLVIELPWSATNPWASTLSTVLLLSIPLHFLIAQHRVYGQGWAVTVTKSIAIGVVYTVLISFGMILAAGLALRLG